MFCWWTLVVVGVVVSCVQLGVVNMPQLEEQRTNLKFLVRSGLGPSASWRALQRVFRQDCMSLKTCQKWHKRFREEGPTSSTSDRPRSGRPKTSTNEEQAMLVHAIVDQDRRKSIRQIADECGIPPTSVFRILKDVLQMRIVNAKFVPRILSTEQKNFRRRLCEDNLIRFMDEGQIDFMSRIVTGDETWISTFMAETKAESRQWQEKGELRPRKAKQVRSRKKSMLTVFFDIKGILLIQFNMPKETIDADRYCATLAQLKENVRRKRPELWEQNEEGDRKFLLHHDNAPAHTATQTLAKLGRWGIQMVAHPPYSPDLAPSDFALFPKLKSMMRGKRFDSVRQMEDEASKILRSLEPAFFRKVMTDLGTRWGLCMQKDGDYFEGDHAQLPSDTETDSD